VTASACPHVDIYGQMLHRCRTCDARYENGQWQESPGDDQLTVLTERLARYEAALKVIALPYDKNHMFAGCAACASVAKSALDGRDWRRYIADIEAADP
jgi:NMD protein affecting ribosome stability and mRNA decay